MPGRARSTRNKTHTLAHTVRRLCQVDTHVEGNDYSAL